MWNTTPNFKNVFWRRPQAWAKIKGNGQYYDIEGTARFYQTAYGVIVAVEMSGLPDRKGNCGGGIFGFHIHEGKKCAGNAADAFADVGRHYNPNDCPHPYHAGDLPPFFSSNGYAFSAVLTNRFTVKEIVGRTVIVHDSVDDFTSQPAGNSGNKIACGEIVE